MSATDYINFFFAVLNYPVKFLFFCRQSHRLCIVCTHNVVGRCRYKNIIEIFSTVNLMRLLRQAERLAAYTKCCVKIHNSVML